MSETPNSESIPATDPVRSEAAPNEGPNVPAPPEGPNVPASPEGPNVPAREEGPNVATPVEAPNVPAPSEGPNVPVPRRPPADHPGARSRGGGPPAQADLAATAAALKERFPALFGSAPLPVKLRIQSDIQERAPGVFTRHALSAFLHRHTTSTPYLAALASAATRFDLDGAPAGEISAEHREAAKVEIERRRELRRERADRERQAFRERARHEREAERGQQRVEDTAQRERAQLLRDFERTTLTKANFCVLKRMTPEQLDAQLEVARREAAARPPPPRPEFPREPRRDGPREGWREGPRESPREGPREGLRDGQRDGPREGPRGGPREGPSAPPAQRRREAPSDRQPQRPNEPRPDRASEGPRGGRPRPAGAEGPQRQHDKRPRPERDAARPGAPASAGNDDATRRADEPGVVVQAEPLRALVRLVVARGGSAAREADLVAENLVEANLTGHDSHGVGMLPAYVANLLAGGLKANASLRVVADAGALVTLDGCAGYGQVMGFEAMALAIERARAHGVAVVGLANSHHIGRIGAWAEQCIAAGLVSVHFVNVLSKPVVAPFGGSDGRFVTNPFCVGIPRPDADPIVLDFATSRIAMGKVRVAFHKGERLARGIVIDAAGQPSTDPAVMFAEPHGALLPFGEHKGYGLAVVCEILGGALAGGLTLHEPPSPHAIINNMLSFVVDPARLGTAQRLAEEASAFAAWVQASPPQPGREVMLPGDPERRKRRERGEHGIPIDATTWSLLLEAGRQVGATDDEMLAAAGVR